MIGIILAIALAQEPTVAVIAPDGTVEIVLRVDAQAQFDKLCADATDDERLKALAAGLHPMPNWAQLVMNGDASVCNRNPKPIVPAPIK